ncbi:hypothetical protein SAMD00019534_002880 [Acytostelium subglobosum LB1]|uniref:hypothetical protein n=1 Tax=Acytostelium subglobosum LB1 TaxID=1410327 RepID=UPI0006450240|nr:hypothetical protein SAMD00019534_002880 [Acytostelium subglobosum LB1]GAM17113.1 hypothetical protein SAMD00019534_002880 [Acytostelium subglobosum LB1]|eukprot:XP_012759175.1 hypothetical protein SAMD00019534_002880 [Acytostelium subglobosum LB1]
MSTDIRAFFQRKVDQVRDDYDAKRGQQHQQEQDLEQQQQYNICISGDVIVQFPLHANQVIIKRPEKLTTVPGSVNTCDVLPKLIANGCYPGLVFNIFALRYNSISSLHCSFNELKCYDRVGEVFKVYRSFLRNNTRAYDYPRPYHYVAGPAETYLARYTPDNNVEVVCLLINHAPSNYMLYNVSKETHIIGEKDFQIEIVNQEPASSLSEAKIMVSQVFKELTNHEMEQDVLIKPKDGYFGHYSTLLPLRHKIPPLKQLCYSLLQALYFVDRDDFNSKVCHLSYDVLKEFCHSCLEDPRPQGYEVAEYLLSTQLVVVDQIVEELFPFNLFVQSMMRRHLHIFNIKQDLNWINESSMVAQPLGMIPLINVYDQNNKHHQKLKFKQIPVGNVLMGAREPAQLTPGSPSIVDMESFLKNFDVFTSDRFKDLTDNHWNNIVFIGGGMTHCLIGAQTKGYEQADIDICFHGLQSITELSNKVEQLMETLGDISQYTITCDQHMIILSRHHPYRHIQINLHKYESIEHILMGVDIDCTCFAYDGHNVWTTQRGVMAMNYRHNFATDYGQRIRGEDQYPRRLIKYVLRGFGIAYFPTPAITDQINKMVKPVEKGHGLELLISAKRDNNIFESLCARTCRSTLPYGPNINREEFYNFITSNFDDNYDSYYGTCDWPFIYHNQGPVHSFFQDLGHNLQYWCPETYPSIRYPFNHFAHGDYVSLNDDQLYTVDEGYDGTLDQPEE